MKKQMYVVMDLVAQESGPIFEAKNDRVAQRQFEELLTNTKSPGDFELIVVGEIDHETNMITPFDPESVQVTVESEVEDDGIN